MAALRVAFDGSLFDERVTGIARYGRELVRGLEGLGLSVEAWGARKSGAVRRSGASRTLWALTELPAQLRQHRPTIFHAIGNFNLPLTRVAGTHLVLTVHDLIPVDAREYVSLPFSLQFRAWLARSVDVADAIVCVSEATRAALVARHPRAAGKCHVVHLGVDHVDRFSRPDATTEAWLDTQALPAGFALYAGALEQRKNVSLVLDAMELARAAQRPFTLVLAGQAWHGGAAIESRVAKLRAQGHDIRHLGYLEDAAFYALIKRASAFVFPSLAEGFGLPPLEAMRLGAPTVISNIPALVEVCGPGALVVGSDDAASLERACHQLLTSTDERRTWSTRGRERAAPFTWERAARETLAVYQGLPG